MHSNPPAAQRPLKDGGVPVAALRLLLAAGFEATSADSIAEAIGISRSTFFRRFGSKEGMVFADQSSRLRAARQALDAHEGEGAGGLVAGALAVFDHATADPELALLRRRLLHEVPALRERELVTTHDFERLFRDFLIQHGGLHDAAQRPDAVALAAAVVAVHNDFLRSWLRSPEPQIRARLRAALERIVALAGRMPSAAPASGAAEAPAQPTVVVLDTDASDPAQVARAVEQALRRRG